MWVCLCAEVLVCGGVGALACGGSVSVGVYSLIHH